MEKKDSSTLLKVAIVGPESTGKTTLASQLSEHYGSPFVAEYAREYLAGRSVNYQEHELIDIARGQLLLEDAITVESGNLLICDTNVLSIKVWSDFKYGHCDAIIRQWVKDLHYDLYFLTDIDVPWTPDPLRENPEGHDRQTLFDMHQQELLQHDFHYQLLSGDQRRRFDDACAAIDRLLNS